MPLGLNQSVRQHQIRSSIDIVVSASALSFMNCDDAQCPSLTHVTRVRSDEYAIICSSYRALVLGKAEPGDLLLAKAILLLLDHLAVLHLRRAIFAYRSKNMRHECPATLYPHNVLWKAAGDVLNLQ